jgi:hypothetical protein
VASAPIGFTRLLFVVGPALGRGSTLRSSHRCPSEAPPLGLQIILSQALAPLQSMTDTSPRYAKTPRLAFGARPFRGFFPFDVFPATRSHITPVDPNPTGYVASPGFLTLPTPCSPCDLPGLFHPGPAFGVLPSRLSSGLGPVRPLERRAPLSFDTHLASTRGAPQGLTYPNQPGHRPGV